MPKAIVLILLGVAATLALAAAIIAVAPYVAIICVLVVAGYIFPEEDK